LPGVIGLLQPGQVTTGSFSPLSAAGVSRVMSAALSALHPRRAGTAELHPRQYTAMPRSPPAHQTTLQRASQSAEQRQ
jgi:hypothetical protein